MDEKTIVDMIAKDDEITWQSIIKELVRTEKMDPWDINVSILSKEYITMLKKLKEFDLRVSGKVLLAATMLLKMKSSRLVGEDLDRLDSMFAYVEEPDCDMEFFSDFDGFFKDMKPKREKGDYRLIPRTPQPRKRRVSIFDLMRALQKAMDVKKRRVFRGLPDHIRARMPEKKRDISLIIREVFGRIKVFFLGGQKKRLTFSQLLPDGATKQEKIHTFVPLLHLSNQRKIDIEQKTHFGEINVSLASRKKVESKA